MEITQQKLDDIKELIEKTEKTYIYQSGLIYGLYNELYNKNEKTSTCGSCVKTRFTLIKKWYNEHKNDVQPLTNEVTKEDVNNETSDNTEPILKKKIKKNI